MREETAPVTAAPSPVRSGLAREAQAAWALAASVSGEGLWYWDVRRHTVRLARRTEMLLGYGMGEAGRHPRDMMRHVDAADAIALRRLIRTLVTGRVTRAELEFRILTRDGARRWVSWRARALRNPQGRVHLVAGAITDIDTRRHTEERLRHEARHDQLTGLPNRAAFMDVLFARIARSAGGGRSFAVAYLDVDRFKVVNDTLGHACGDAVLSETATRLQGCVGPDDVLARLGGDEFVVLVDDTTDAERICGAMHRAMAGPISANGRPVFAALSMGLRVAPGERCKPSDIIRDADLAMYEAKRNGGARTVRFESSMHDALIRRFSIHNELQGALYDGDFRIAYHPIFDTAEDRLCGFEALLRWQHPGRGLLHAAEFIQDANESGAIIPIGRWVLREACRQVTDWARTYPNAQRISVGVNMCDRELLDPEFVASVQGILEETGVDPGQLRLEMTEGAVAGNYGAVVPVLERLRKLGVQIQLDGFGAGRTSIGMLRHLPLTAIKIDRGVIASIMGCEDMRALVATILGYAARLGLDVIADGVDCQEQVELLASLGPCRYVQGAVARELVA